MKKIIFIVLFATLVSSCALLPWTTPSSKIIINYHDKTLTVNNNSGKAFKLNIIYKDNQVNNAKVQISGYIDILEGRKVYKLHFHDPDKKFLKEFEDTNSYTGVENSITIFTKISNYGDASAPNQKLFEYFAESNLKLENSRATILFNSEYSPDFYAKVEGLTTINTNDGYIGIGSLVKVTKDSKGEVFIGGWESGTYTGLPIKPIIK
jgi:hypothetical protein